MAGAQSVDFWYAVDNQWNEWTSGDLLIVLLATQSPGQSCRIPQPIHVFWESLTKHTFCPAMTAITEKHDLLTRDMLSYSAWSFCRMAFPPPSLPSPPSPLLLQCLPELDSNGWLHSKVGRPMVLSLRVNQKLSYPFIPTAHLCTDILACFSPRRRRDKMSTPRERAVHTHTLKHTLRHSHSSANVSWTPLRRWQFLFVHVLLRSPLEHGWHWSNAPQSSTVINRKQVCDINWMRKKKRQGGRRRGIDTAENDLNQISLGGFGDLGRKGDWRLERGRYQLEFSGGQTALQRQSFQSHWLRCINIGLCCISPRHRPRERGKELFYPVLQEGNTVACWRQGWRSYRGHWFPMLHILYNTEYYRYSWLNKQQSRSKIGQIIISFHHYLSKV